MKVGMWAVGILVLSLFGVVLVNLFGNITVTDQLNYTTMKNTVEAAMYDSLDTAHFSAGFCLCTNLQKKDGKYNFTDNNQYELFDITYDENRKPVCNSTTKATKYSSCEQIYGEYRIKPHVFAESLIRRFAEMVNNSKDYSIVIQDIIEYPPKVSIRVTSKDTEFSPTEEHTSDNEYYIVNQMDAILETKSGTVEKFSITVPDPTPSPTPVPPNVTPTPKISLTIRPVDETVPYNGTNQSSYVHRCDIISGNIPPGHILSCQTTASGQDAGTYPKTTVSYTITSGGQNVTSNFDINVEPGKFIITPINPEVICKNPSYILHQKSTNRNRIYVQQDIVMSWVGDRIVNNMQSVPRVYTVTVYGNSKNFKCRDYRGHGTCVEGATETSLSVPCMISNSPCKWVYDEDKLEVRTNERCYNRGEKPECTKGSYSSRFTDGAIGGPWPEPGCNSEGYRTYPICYCTEQKKTN